MGHVLYTFNIHRIRMYGTMVSARKVTRSQRYDHVIACAESPCELNKKYSITVILREIDTSNGDKNVRCAHAYCYASITFNQIVLSTSAPNRATIPVIYFQLFREAVGEQEPIPMDDVTPTKDAVQGRGIGERGYGEIVPCHTHA
jgi:hypothetical protein